MRTNGVSRLAGSCSACLSLTPLHALAQTGAASITGLVTDQSGAAVPGVTVSP